MGACTRVCMCVHARVGVRMHVHACMGVCMRVRARVGVCVCVHVLPRLARGAEGATFQPAEGCIYRSGIGNVTFSVASRLKDTSSDAHEQFVSR